MSAQVNGATRNTHATTITTTMTKEMFCCAAPGSNNKQTTDSGTCRRGSMPTISLRSDMSVRQFVKFLLLLSSWSRGSDTWRSIRLTYQRSSLLMSLCSRLCLCCYFDLAVKTLAAPLTKATANKRLCGFTVKKKSHSLHYVVIF